MTTAAHIVEKKRMVEQVRLDALKSAAERNKWGQFATPSPLAVSLARHARTLMGDERVRFLDPAIGTGSFYSALLDVSKPEDIAEASGVELDPLFVKAARALWEGHGLSIVHGDFTRLSPPSARFNLVLTNPPYVRHHHLSGEDKDRLKAQLAQSLQMSISGLAGLYCYFLLHAHDWMEDNGLAVWLIPSEFMDVNYGTAVRRYLSERVTLLEIHRFCPTDVQFTDALVSSAVVIFRKAVPPEDHAVRFSFGGPIDGPQHEAMVPLDVVRSSHKWTQFPSTTAVRDRDVLNLGDLFAIKRGLATGDNGFFILSEDRVNELQIPQAFLRPILPGPRHLTGDVVDALPSGSPDVSPRLFLLDCNEPEEDIKAQWPRLYEYLQHGKAEKVDTAYLAAHRARWYSQEQRPPAPFLCTYMGRSRNGKHPFRFIWNRSQATAHNVYLMLYPKGPLLHALTADPALAGRVFEALKDITPAQLLSEGRVYGGGLHKVEPKELAQIPAQPILDAIDGAVQIEQQQRLFA
ncbi:MAG TPA: N-6 DNA methylase [Terracidiphilus sp.]|nr:N-6 DNA methylase [Terracidiphilus sp.]